ncbi:MAG: ROK family protein [Erysipelotrichales bacterium]|nr:ROK family protein [Erysipelotrichales bacterium]
MSKLVFDIGGTFIKYALMSDDCSIIKQDKIKTPEYELDAMLEALKGVIDEYRDSIDGIAFSLPGMMDSEKGYMYSGGSIRCFYQVDFFELMKRITDLPVAIENDGKCAALAELGYGNLKGIANGVVVVLGTGIGGGIIKDGKLYKGSHFSAGEFSFMNIHNTTEFKDVWAVGNSVPGFVARVEAELGKEQGSLDGRDVFKLIEENNEVACRHFKEYINTLAIQLLNIQAILDPEIILVGGGVSQQPLLIEALQSRLKEMIDANPIYKLPIKVGVCKYFNDSNLIGALYNFQQMYSK